MHVLCLCDDSGVLEVLWTVVYFGVVKKVMWTVFGAILMLLMRKICFCTQHHTKFVDNVESILQRCY